MATTMFSTLKDGIFSPSINKICSKCFVEKEGIFISPSRQNIKIITVEFVLFD